MEEPGGLRSMGSQRVEQNLVSEQQNALDTVLNAKDTAVKNILKNPCPHRAYILIRKDKNTQNMYFKHNFKC